MTSILLDLPTLLISTGIALSLVCLSNDSCLFSDVSDRRDQPQKKVCIIHNRSRPKSGIPMHERGERILLPPGDGSRTQSGSQTILLKAGGKRGPGKSRGLKNSIFIGGTQAKDTAKGLHLQRTAYTLFSVQVHCTQVYLNLSFSWNNPL